MAGRQNKTIPAVAWVAFVVFGTPALAAENAAGASGGFGGLDALELTALFSLLVVGFWVFSRIKFYRSRGPDDTTKKRAADAWTVLRSTPEPSESVVRDAGLPAKSPEGFDQADFLDGARLLYSRLQTAWAARKIDDIRPFVTDDMLAAIGEECRRDPAPKEVAVVLVEGSFAGLEENDGEERASVLFKALLREGEAAPAEVRELWHFVRGEQTEGMWRLDGVESVGAA